MTAALNRSFSSAMRLLLTNRSSMGRTEPGSLRRAGEVGHLLVGQRDHFLQTLAVAARKRPQASRQIVVEHQIPAAEELLGQKLGQDAVAELVVTLTDCEPSRACCREGRTSTWFPRNRARTGVKPRAETRPGDRRGICSRHLPMERSRLGRSFSGFTRENLLQVRFEDGGGSSSSSVRPVMCWSSLMAFSVCFMLSVTEST